MTDAEKEFAVLVDAIDSATIKYSNLAASMPNEPDYAHYHTSGHHTPSEMSAYKNKLAEYRSAKSALDDAAKDVADAASALDAWIPKPTHERLALGVSIVAPVPAGYASLRKPSGQYIVIKGRTVEEIRHKQAEYIARYEQNR